ncbi:MAG: quinolinate synthase NadA [Planctomycetes bacterium]|nr:quinolinate synthase NadA [Planctomycetota bacterium]
MVNAPSLVTNPFSPPLAVPHDPKFCAVPPGIDLLEAIVQLKKERNAILLAHYYQEGDIQDIADFVGDSLELSRRARDAKDASVICFCGVHFMAESAKCLAPDKIVILPDLEAGCSLAEACPPEALAEWKRRHPDYTIVAYINTSAATKALCDWICTSSNAEKVIRAIPENEKILFVPDRHLGDYLIKKTGRKMELWPGSCIVHETFNARKIVALKTRHPGAKLIAHPECDASVLEHAEFVGSTSKLLEFVITDPAAEFIVATERGILHEMRKRAPGKILLEPPVDTGPDAAKGACASCNECPHMRRNTLEKVYLALRDLQPRIEIGEELRLAALRPLERMLSLK